MNTKTYNDNTSNKQPINFSRKCETTIPDPNEFDPYIDKSQLNNAILKVLTLSQLRSTVTIRQ